jgi:long-chain fatty acid transport protein
MHSARSVLSVLLVCISVWPVLGHANADAAFSGIAAKVDDAVSANRNPAGLARIKESEWAGQAIYFKSKSTFVTTEESAGGVSTTHDDGDTFVPIIYYARPLTERLGFGMTFQGMSFNEDYGDDTLQRYLVEDFTLTQISFVPSLGYRINDKWSVGAGLNINYSYYELNRSVFNGIGQPDGDFELEADDISLSFNLGLVYEYSQYTRFGLRYSSESDPEMSGKPDYKNVTNQPERREIKVKSTFPQGIVGGVYHEFQSRDWVTADLAYIDFSEFGISEFQIGDFSIETQEQNFDDVWATTLGYNHYLNDKWIVKVGGLYIDQPVSDDNRTASWRLDRMWGLGVGAEYRFTDKKQLAFNFTYMDMGDAPVRAEDGRRGTLVGEFEDKYALIFDISYRWVTGGGPVIKRP